MLRIFPLLFVFCASGALAQMIVPSRSEALAANEYDGLLDFLYLYNTGNARSEAMGKTTVAEANSCSYSIHNPALLDALKSFELQAGMMKPIYYDDNGRLSSASGAMRIKKRFVCGASVLKIKHEERGVYDNDSKKYFISSPTDFRFNLCGDYAILDRERHKLDAGVGLNYASYYYYERVKYDGTHIDLGAHYRYIPDSVKLFSAGISVNNITNQPFHYIGNLEDPKQIRHIPQILRAGISFNYKPRGQFMPGKFRKLEATLVAEINEILNNNYFSTIKFGGEFKLFEMICLRAGGYFGKWANISTVSVRGIENGFESFTCGIGLEVPFRKLLSPNVPILVGFDMSATPYGLVSIEDTLIHFIRGKANYSIVNFRISVDLQ